MADEYTAVTSPDEEEEERKRLAAAYPAPSPVAAAPPAPAPVPPISAAPPVTRSAPANKWQSVTPPAPDLPLEQPAAPRRPEWSQYKPAERHGWGKFGSIMATLNPAANEIVNKRPVENAQRNYQAATSDYDKTQSDKLALEKQTSETNLQGAEAEHATAAAEALRHPQPKPKEEEWSVVPSMVGPKGEPVQQEKNSGQIRFAPGMNGVSPLKPPAERPDTPEQQFIDEYQKTHPGAPVAKALSAYAATTQKPEHEPRQMVVGPDGTVIELHPGDKVPAGSKTAAKYGEPTADEQRRADLTENLNENLSALEEIVNRKPELFGPVHGRLTGLKAMIGTDDPDIAALETIKHQLGMAQISAHGMRSAQGIAAASDSILNSFHNSPDAVRGAINAARKSVSTFTQDVERKQGGGQGAESQPPKPADPGMKWQHRTTNGKTEWRQAPQ